MKYLKILRFISSLPEILRVISYIIYLFYQILINMKVFFNPHKGFTPKSRTTDVPRETEDGVVFDSLSNSELFNRYSKREATTYDPAFLASNGIEPVKFSGSVVSPLDGYEQLCDLVDDIKDLHSSSQFDESSNSVDESSKSVDESSKSVD